MTNEERKLALYCLKANSDFHKEICEECDMYPSCDHFIQDSVTEMLIEELEQQPCYNPDEWCHDCSEYNHDKHCCPRYNGVIRKAVEEMKQESKTGYWILLDECSNSGYYCSECRKKVVKEGWSGTVKKIKYCPNCGARMIESQEVRKRHE